MSIDTGEMSIRTTAQTNNADQIRAELDALRRAQSIETTESGAMASDALSIDDLNETERSAATIGAAPDAWRPIGFMNEAHFTTLLKNNAVGSRLAQQIEAYRAVSRQ